MIIIHDSRLPQEYLSELKGKLPRATLIPFEGGDVYESIRCHPDIHFFKLDDHTIIHSPAVNFDVLRTLAERGIDLIRGEEKPFGKYPDTAGYNAIRAGDVLFHNREHTDGKILAECAKRGLRVVDIKQGYARCSVIAVGDRALITSDRGIAVSAREEGFDVLLLPAGNIELPGEGYGFIGGASGNMPDGTVVFLGDIRHHPEGSEISAFLDKNDVKSMILTGFPLYDAGSLLIFDKLSNIKLC